MSEDRAVERPFVPWYKQGGFWLFASGWICWALFGPTISEVVRRLMIQ